MVFSVGDRRLALPLSAVERVIRAVAVTAVTDAPPRVQGVIDVGGIVTPVMSPRARLGIDDRPVGLSDRLIIVRGPQGAVALPVDAVHGVVEVSASDWIEQVAPSPVGRSFGRVVRVDGDLVPVASVASLLAAPGDAAESSGAEAGDDSTR